ncbi:hypothetical protein DM02DRAFT_218153 [Periconia macrospinosa]|uniref:Eisosome protein 1 n=1 Tax=Periconia macrospinosa TaxID=97972 RepID=A0A2V1DZS8_9PLEO|nr:hypothetical protein DM02DRAFT_218153 [Periconia macrospinosa]
MATKTEAPPPESNTHMVTFEDSQLDSSASPSTGMHCPDPSAHNKTKDSALQNQASAAALYSTNPTTANKPNVLGPDGKLSSASAATSLKHAQAHTLPSFPVVGIDTRTSAGTAANLASTNTKSPEWWKPELSSAAGKAALLANDYKMQPLWKPEASAAGSKAALLAHRDAGKLNLWTPQPSTEGNSAATIAMGKKDLSPNVVLGSNEDQKRKALLAATGAVSSSGRKRAQSTPASPPLYPDAGNSAKNALTAATMAHNPSLKAANSPLSTSVTDSNRLGSPAMQAARIQHSKVSREMYTEHPPVALEVEEKKRQDALRASAISMAKKMYDVQQHHIDQASGRSSHAQTGATTAHSQKPQTPEDEIKQQAMRYLSVQEAAQKLAAERLAKIGMDENAMYRSYYGYEKPSRHRLSIRRGRNRASSNPEPADSDDDELQSRRIRSQMYQFNKSLAEVDRKKQEMDRRSLHAAAERKVQAQMLGIDKKIFDETGKMSPAMLEEWDAKARAKAAANSEMRMEHHGKVHIGHGKYMDQADIDAVAQARIQPTLDEITEKTEKRRAEEEERRLEEAERKRQAQIDKERADELKADEKRGLEGEKKALKAKAEAEKAAARQEKEAEKERKAEEKRLAKEEKRKTKEAAKSTHVDTAAIATTHDDNASRGLTAVEPRSEPDHETASPTSPASPAKGIKSLFNKLKRRSKQSNPSTEPSSEANNQGFIGGVALRNSESHPHSRRNSAPVSVHSGTGSAGPARQNTSSGRRYSDISSLSSSAASSTRERALKRTATTGTESPEAEYEEARDTFNESLAPPPTFTSNASSGSHGSSNRDSKFIEAL